MDADYRGDFGSDVVRAYRKVIWYVRQAPDERALYGLKSLHDEKLKGQRAQQRSLRLNRQWRLIVELTDDVGRTVVIVAIEDYH